MAGGEDGSTEARLRALARRVEALESKLREEHLAIEKVLQELRLLRMVSPASASILKSASRHRRHRYGDIARHIVDVLLKAGPLNISQLTDRLREERGTASRRIVAEKLGILKKHGLVARVPGRKSERLYELAKGKGRRGR